MFKRKSDGFDRAKKYHLCTACLHFQGTLFDVCPKCQAKGMRQFFSSQIEMMRGCELIRMQSQGLIKELKFQPRFNLIPDIFTNKMVQYIGDSSYIEGEKHIIEDVKPAGKFIDKLAEVKISLFHSLYCVPGHYELRIRRRK